MGGASRFYRGGRFIEEFNEDYQRVYGARGDFVRSCGLGQSDLDGCVRFYFSIAFSPEDVRELCEDVVLYDPDGMNEDVVETVSKNLRVPESVVEERLKKADLW